MNKKYKNIGINFLTKIEGLDASSGGGFKVRRIPV